MSDGAAQDRQWQRCASRHRGTGSQRRLPSIVFTCLAAGWHHLQGIELAGFISIYADVRQGTRRDALLYSFSANSRHGFRRTNADKQRAVDMMILDDEWTKLTDAQIADHCSVTKSLVASRRPQQRPADDFLTKYDERRVFRSTIPEPNLAGNSSTAANPAPQPAAASVSRANRPKVRQAKPDPCAVPEGWPVDVFPADDTSFDYGADRLRKRAMWPAVGLPAAGG